MPDLLHTPLRQFRKPRFLYFDLGNVLLYFDHRLACRQMAEVAGVDPQRVWEIVFTSGMQVKYERGELTTAKFHRYFCREIGCPAGGPEPDEKKLARAGSAIFRVNASMKSIVAQLVAAGWRLGLLSNTCEMHWDYFASGRYSMIPEAFAVHALSFRLGATKPDPAIFVKAAEMAGVSPHEIFYVDDTLEHVESARKVGYDAVHYTTTPQFVADLRKRGIEFNY